MTRSWAGCSYAPKSNPWMQIIDLHILDECKGDLPNKLQANKCDGSHLPMCRIFFTTPLWDVDAVLHLGGRWAL